MPRNTKEIITRDRLPEIRAYRNTLIVELYTKHKYTLEEISLVFKQTPQGIFKIIKTDKQNEKLVA